jgi:hypothetical protein
VTRPGPTWHLRLLADELPDAIPDPVVLKDRDKDQIQAKMAA